MFQLMLRALTLFRQADPGQIPGLIDKLRSDKIEERQEAERKLKELGETAGPALRKAAQGPDAELALRARGILKSWVKSLLPEVVDRALRWLPEDTEVIMVARGPFALEKLERERADRKPPSLGTSLSVGSTISVPATGKLMVEP